MIDLDVAARHAALTHADKNLVLVSFDTAAAFPSLGRATLRQTLQFHRLPQHARLFAEATMTGGRIRLQGASAGDSGFVARRVVPQGCPLSSPLFLLCTQPILRLLQETVPGCLCIRAFADDIAAVFDDVSRIGNLLGPLTAWEKATGLALNLKKTKIVLLNANPGHAQPDPARRAREALQYFPPPWSTMQVAMTVRYLGVEIGPHTSSSASRSCYVALPGTSNRSKPSQPTYNISAMSCRR